MTIYAPRTITYTSTLLTDQLRDAAASSPDLVVVTVDEALLDDARNELAAILAEIGAIRGNGRAYAARSQEIDAIDAGLDVALIPTDTALQIMLLKDREWEALSLVIMAVYDDAVREASQRIDAATAERLNREIVPLAIDEQIGALTTTDEAMRALIARFVTPFLKINVSIDQVATTAARQKARAETPLQMSSLQMGQTIVSKGDILDAVQYEKLQMSGLLESATNWDQVAGQILLAVGLALLLSYTLWRNDKRSGRKPRELFAVMVLVIAVVVCTRVLAWLNAGYILATPIVMMMMIFSALFGIRTANLITMNVALMVLVIANGSVVYSLPPLVGALVAGMLIRNVTRSRVFVVAGVGAAAASAVMLIGVTLLTAVSIEWIDMAPLLLYSVGGSLLSALLALGLYNVVGRMAGILTPLMLLELAHPAEPLVRRLMREAPGTYAHSIAVGNLAESAAEAIGADGLLLRVASYFHDIGKLKRPYFFVDNQNDGVNLHDTLPPQESARIIIDHVRDGIVMANAAGLPDVITAFIRTHHGTSQVRAFVNKAVAAGIAYDEAEFTYPGPIPYTREQALLMLADSVEATVRSKIQSGALVSASDGTGYQFDGVVSSIFEDRLAKGQLADTPITIAELKLVHDAFVKTLKGIYHPRIDYSPKEKRIADPVVVPQGHV
jgi:putative nucleotidyltransferase with HDIG domain